jgi:hypothetical protein
VRWLSGEGFRLNVPSLSLRHYASHYVLGDKINVTALNKMVSLYHKL